MHILVIQEKYHVFQNIYRKKGHFRGTHALCGLFSTAYERKLVENNPQP